MVNSLFSQAPRPRRQDSFLVGLLAGAWVALSGCAQIIGIEETTESSCNPEPCNESQESGGSSSGGGNPGGGTDAGGGAGSGGVASSGGTPGMGGSPGGSGGTEGDGSGGRAGSGGSPGGGGTGGSGGDGTGGDGAGGDGAGGQAQRGPVLVEVDGFFIDATEVTNSQYEEFLASKDGDTSGQPAECAFNDVYTPSDAWPNTADLPVTYVDWCDARAFCDWAGKRLCGGIDGSQLTDANLTDESVSEWYRACVGPDPGGGNNYPYGGVYQEEVCNDLGYQEAHGYPGLVEVGSLVGCEGHPSGVFDMVGNVNEWVDHCKGTMGAEDVCETVGATRLSEVTCRRVPTRPRWSAFAVVRIDLIRKLTTRSASNPLPTNAKEANDTSLASFLQPSDDSSVELNHLLRKVHVFDRLFHARLKVRPTKSRINLLLGSESNSVKFLKCCPKCLHCFVVLSKSVSPA